MAHPCDTNKMERMRRLAFSRVKRTCPLKRFLRNILLELRRRTIRASASVLG
jgi:transposase